MNTTPLSVASVSCFTAASTLKRPFVTAKRRTEYVESVITEVTLADGTWGQGSAAETVAVTGESASTMTAAIDGPIGTALTGRSGTLAELSDAVAASLPGSTSAKAAVDVALHDAWARSLGLPLAEALGGRVGTLTHDMTVSLEDPAVMGVHAREAADAGYRILKIKLGTDAALDRERLAAVVESAPGARLRLDANQGWTPDEAVSIITGMADAGFPVDLIEQPVAKDDLAGLARVTAASPIPIMADESLQGIEDARRLVDAHAVDLFNIKLAKTGGLHAAWAVADIAHDAGLACMVGEMMEPRISTCAAAHLASAHPAITMIDLDAPEWFVDDVPAGGYTTADGELRLLGGPGFGLERQLPAS